MEYMYYIYSCIWKLYGISFVYFSLDGMWMEGKISSFSDVLINCDPSPVYPYVPIVIIPLHGDVLNECSHSTWQSHWTTN